MQRTPAEALISPLALAALALLVANDHLVKQRWPGFWSGKLSDLAGLVLLPIVLQAVVELIAGRPAPSPQLTRACCLVVGVGFVLMETWPPASLAFRNTLGLLQWPFRALYAGELVAFKRVRHWADVEDLMALPALWLPWRLGVRNALAHQAESVPPGLIVEQTAPSDDDTGRG